MSLALAGYYFGALVGRDKWLDEGVGRYVGICDKQGSTRSRN